MIMMTTIIKKTIRLLNYFEFNDVDNLTIKVKELKHNSFDIKVVDEQQNTVLTIQVYRFPREITQWYIDIPVLLNKDNQVVPIGDINNNDLAIYLSAQSKYLKIFDKLHNNATYEDTTIQVTMDIIETLNDEPIPEKEFSLEKWEFTSKVRHPHMIHSSFGILIEKSVKISLKESGLFNVYEATDITEKTLNEALLLCDMMTI